MNRSDRLKGLSLHSLVLPGASHIGLEGFSLGSFHATFWSLRGQLGLSSSLPIDQAIDWLKNKHLIVKVSSSSSYQLNTPKLARAQEEIPQPSLDLQLDFDRETLDNIDICRSNLAQTRKPAENINVGSERQRLIQMLTRFSPVLISAQFCHRLAQLGIKGFTCHLAADCLRQLLEESELASELLPDYCFEPTPKTNIWPTLSREKRKNNLCHLIAGPLDDSVTMGRYCYFDTYRLPVRQRYILDNLTISPEQQIKLQKQFDQIALGVMKKIIDHNEQREQT